MECSGLKKWYGRNKRGKKGKKKKQCGYVCGREKKRGKKGKKKKKEREPTCVERKKEREKK